MFIGILRRMSIKFWNINRLFTDSVLKLMFVKYPKNSDFSMVLFNAALRKQFWCKTFQIRYFGWRTNGTFYCEKRSLYFKEEPLRDMQLDTFLGALGSKISGIKRFNYWLINRKSSFKTRINMRNQLFWQCIFWKNSSYEKVVAL